MTWSVGWPAPAKINRFLHIVGRRADGYHLLETAFQFLDLADELSFRLRDDGVIQRIDPETAGEADLTVRAARRLAQMMAGTPGVDIHVAKWVPAGGGLGGGSSDAATTLVALNHLWGVDLSQAELETIGLELGADVPVFIRGEAAWGEGVGEQLSALTIDDAWVVIVDPGVAVSTAACFGAPELTRNVARSRMRRLGGDRQCNVFEPVVRERYPAVAAALDWLAPRLPTRLTGSGGCCFGLAADEGSAKRVAADVPAGWRGLAARAIGRSPLAQRLAQARRAGASTRATGA